MKVNIEQVLQSERAWEYILLDIVESEELDPWDIDVTKLTESYTKRIKKMKSLDLRIPARLILAAAVLLKMQSDELVMTEEDNEMFEELFYDEELEEEYEEGEEPSMLDLRVKRKPVRKVTLGDLVTNLQKALEKKEEKPPEYEPEEFELKLEEVDISKKIDEIYAKILKSHLDKIAFSKLLKNKSRDEVIDTLLPLLHLANNRKIDLEQKKFFEELFVVPKKEKKAK
ncbi:MAG: segregation/condensation protein A [Candidatus Undinarchaeales archaeon]